MKKIYIKDKNFTFKLILISENILYFSQKTVQLTFWRSTLEKEGKTQKISFGDMFVLAIKIYNFLHCSVDCIFIEILYLN